MGPTTQQSASVFAVLAPRGATQTGRVDEDQEGNQGIPEELEAIGVERTIYLMAFMRMRFFRVVLLFSCAYPRPATDPSLKTLTLGGNK
jgi:hypothetical protein